MGLSSVHSAGRGWISAKIGSLPESEGTRELESTLLSVYDNMYQQWVDRWVAAPLVFSVPQFSSTYYLLLIRLVAGDVSNYLHFRNVSSSRGSNVTMNHLLASVKGNMVSLDLFSLKSAKSNIGHLIRWVLFLKLIPSQSY